MKITAIKQQTKRSDSYSIYVDGRYLFSLSGGELLANGLFVGQELDETGLAELKEKAVLDMAVTRSLDLISRRPRSEWELKDYLKRKGYDPAISRPVLEKLKRSGYIDDSDFAMRWVANRRLLKATNKRLLVQELRQKRIPDEIIDEVLAADETDEHEVLKELIQRKRQQTKYQDNLKLMQYLSRQGFSYDDIKSALQEN